MRKPARALVIAVAVPFLTGCIRTMPRPLPEPSARAGISVRGVVLGGSTEGERVEFADVDRVQWTDSTIEIRGVLKDPGTDHAGQLVTRTHRLSDIGAVLVRRVDPNRTSILIAAVAVGISVIMALRFTGKTTDSTVF
jgi:hypothetical protein